LAYLSDRGFEVSTGDENGDLMDEAEEEEPEKEVFCSICQVKGNQ
jgi:hypothetical protein